MRVIIIGAGIAGLSAARHLENSFLKEEESIYGERGRIDNDLEIVILEGRDRIGGRVAQAEGFDIPIDLGASWIHGVTGNPLADIANELKLRLDITDNPSLTSGNYFEVYDDEGNTFDATIESKVRAKFQELTKVGRQFMDALGKDLPLETVLSLDESDQLTDPKEVKFFNWLKSGIEGWDNTNLSNLSARGHFWENENQFHGGDGFVIDGFFSIINQLAQSQSHLINSPTSTSTTRKKVNRKLLLNHVITKIEQQDSQNEAESVKIHTRDHGIITGDYVIVTVPLGVLKAGLISFEPRLPEWKTQSIKNIGFGLMNKIVLEFDSIFWRENGEGIGYVGEQRGEFNFFLNLHPLTGKPILMGFVAADFAHHIENWTDEEIVKKVDETLLRIYKNKKSVLKRYKITRWGKDQFALGSYSFLAFGSTLNDIERIAQPVGRVHFAGEATFKPLGFTHGAYLSGEREAARLMTKMKNKHVTNNVNINISNMNIHNVINLNHEQMRRIIPSNQISKMISFNQPLSKL